MSLESRSCFHTYFMIFTFTIVSLLFYIFADSNLFCVQHSASLVRLTMGKTTNYHVSPFKRSYLISLFCVRFDLCGAASMKYRRRRERTTMSWCRQNGFEWMEAISDFQQSSALFTAREKYEIFAWLNSCFALSLVWTTCLLAAQTFVKCARATQKYFRRYLSLIFLLINNRTLRNSFTRFTAFSFL